MQINRKTQLTVAARLRRHRLFACCLASTLGIANPFSLNSSHAFAFDMPPATGIANPSTTSRSETPPGNSDALKRVGIRFVGSPANAPRLPSSKPIVQPPLLIENPKAFATDSVSTEFRPAGIRIRIPSETKQIEKSVVEDDKSKSREEPLKLTVGGPTPIQLSKDSKAKSAPVGTGFAPLPNVGNVAETSVKSSVTFQPPTLDSKARSQATGKDSLVMKTPSQQGSSSESNPPTPMTSRTPGVVKLPGMTVAGNMIASTQKNTAPEPAGSAPDSKSSSVSGGITGPAFVNSESTFAMTNVAVARNGKANSSAANDDTRLPRTVMAETTTNPSSLTLNSESPSLSLTALPATMNKANPSLNIQAQTVSAVSIESGFPLPKVVEGAPRNSGRLDPTVVKVALASSVTEELARPTGLSSEMIDNGGDVSNAGNGPIADANAKSVSVPLRNIQVVTVTGTINQVKIEDESVCKVITTGPSNLTIVGASIGDTKLTVWTTDSASKASSPQDFRINVREAWGEAANSTVSIEEVNQSISKLFPRCSVAIKTNEDGSLTVQGKATNNDVAKHIIMLVRKMFLVPVQDRIAVTHQ